MGCLTSTKWLMPQEWRRIMACKTIAVANQKGRTGKTATTLSLGIALAKLDKRVLLVDTDPQGDLTKSLGWSNPDSLEITVANHIQAVIDGVDLQASKGILSHKEGIDLMPANIDLASMEMDIFMAMSREQILNTWLSGIKDLRSSQKAIPQLRTKTPHRRPGWRKRNASGSSTERLGLRAFPSTAR